MNQEIYYKAVLARDRRYDGRFFTAVITTGIFCRPICPARPPKRENCTFMPSAAAALAAGFRPCLRCRPELSPDLPGWHGTSTTVTKALRYISEGFLNGHNVPELAERMGVGSRHLRRLFQRHMGTSPDNVALTRRLLMAKQLLSESRLSIAQIAHAAGFQSLRRFNDAFSKNFRQKPSSIRKKKAAHGKTDIILNLGYTAPYDWPAILNYLKPRLIPGVENIKADQYARTFLLNGKAGNFTISPLTDKDMLSVRISGADVAALPLILSRIRHIFDLDSNINVINSHLSEQPQLADLIKINPGIRVIGAWDPFELTVRAILGQQVSVAAATTLIARLVAKCGMAIESGKDGLSHIFPTPGTLANAELSNLGITASRIKVIIHLAQTLDKDPEFFHRPTSLVDFITHLCRLPGIGPWTAQYVAMRAMGEADAFPASDLVLLKRMKKDGRKITAKELENISQDWRPWRAYAAMYIWANSTEKGDKDD